MVGSGAGAVLCNGAGEERHEANACDFMALPAVFTRSLDARQGLYLLSANRNDQPSADGELLFQRFRHVLSLRSNEDGIEGCLRLAAFHAIACHDMAVSIAERGDPFACLFGQRLVSLYRHDKCGDARQYGGGIA